MAYSFDLYIEVAMLTLSHSIKVIKQAHNFMDYMSSGLVRFILNREDCKESALHWVILIIIVVFDSTKKDIC